MRRYKIGVVLAIAIFVAIAGTAFATTATKADNVTLTLWHNYGNDSDATAAKNLVAAFEKLHPNIKIKLVSQPGSNYFALLQAASISKTGPDMSVQWTGLFDLKYQQFLVNLKPYLSAAQIAKINAAKYMAPDFNTSQGLLVMPESSDFYIGFYNKKLFKQAGITSVPTNWTQLQAACTKLKGIGVTPMEYGLTAGLVLGSSFYPWYDISYLMLGLYTPAQWKNLYTGQTPWTAPAIESQLEKWVALHKNGCTNSDVLTASNSLDALAKGKAAMIVDGTWDEGTLQKLMGSNLGAFVPPYTNSKIHGVVDFPGQGFSVMKYSKHIPEDIEFIKFMMTAQAAKIIGDAGLVPDVEGYKTSNALTNQLLGLISKGGYTAYPMLDNIVQPEVVSAAQKEVVAAFGGQVSVQAALKNMQDTLNSLPASRRGKNYTGG